MDSSKFKKKPNKQKIKKSSNRPEIPFPKLSPSRTSTKLWNSPVLQTSTQQNIELILQCKNKKNQKFL